MENNVFEYKKGSLILLSGIPGSGKSTFAKKYFNKDNLKENYLISSDEIRDRYFGEVIDYENGKLYNTNNNEEGELVFSIMKGIAKRRCENGLTTVIDAMNLRDKSRNEFVKLGNWSEIITIVFDKSLDDCITNNLNRSENGGRYVPIEVLNKKFENFSRTSEIKNMRIIKANKISYFNENLNEYDILKDDSVVFFGDIHGVENFKEIYEKIRDENDPRTKIIFTGDIIDRGDYSVDNLLFLMEESKKNKNLIFIKGNHEEKIVRHLKKFVDTGEIGKFPAAAYETFNNFLKIDSGNYEFKIKELEGKKFPIQKVINFLMSFKDLVILNNKTNGERVICTHAQILPPKNLGNILASDCLFGMNRFRGYSENNILNENYLKALYGVAKERNLKFINGHVDYEDLILEFCEKNSLDKNEFPIKSIEGGIDRGGNLVTFKYSGNGKTTTKKFKSNLEFNSDNIIRNGKGDFDDMVKRNIVNGKESHEKYKSLTIYKYGRKVFYNHLWGTYSEKENKILELARGLVLDNNGNIVSFPFDKIFNYGEKVSNNENKLEAGKKYEFIKKFNGFLGVVSPDPYKKNELLIHTQGSLDKSKFNDFITNHLTEFNKLEILKFFREKGKHTLMFEVIHEDDPHIIFGESYGLKLIGARDISSNNIENCPMLSEKELDDLGERLGFKRPEHKVALSDDILSGIKNNFTEGFVIRDIETGKHILKLKTPYYLNKKFLGRMGEGNYKFLFANKNKFIQEKNIEEEFFGVVDYIHNNKGLFENSNDIERINLIGEFFLKN